MTPPRKRGKSQLTPLSETLGRSLGQGYLNIMAQKLRVFEIWPRVVGSEDAAHSRPVEIHHGRLTVLVPGPIWLDRFNYKKPQWLALLNNELANDALIEEIILKISDQF